MKMRFIVSFLIFILALAHVSAYSGSEAGYHITSVIPHEFADASPEDSYKMTFIVNPTTSGYSRSEGGYKIGLNLYTSGVGGGYSDEGYKLYLVPEQAFISYSYDITANDPSMVTINIETYDISLIHEWNLISIPLEQGNWSITSVLVSIEGNYSVVYAYIDGLWNKSTAERDPLTNMSLEYGYWIDMIAPDTLELNGTFPPPTTMNVIPEWNLMGYPSLNTQNITTVLSPINYTGVFAYINGSWKKSTAAREHALLTNMTTGYGYLINATDVGTYEVSN